MYILISLILISYYIYLKIVYGGLTFSIFFVFVAIGLIIYNLIKDHIKKITPLYEIIKYSSLVFISTFILVEGLLVFYPKQNINSNCDYMIILGASVKGTTPSLTLQGRLDAALDYIENNNNKNLHIVVSGGQGSDENISEATAMKNYLIKHGVSENKIIVEDKSTSTFENFIYSKKKIEQHSSTKISDLNIKVVTTDFHAFRSLLISKKVGYKNITFYCSKSLPQFMPTYYTREFFAFIKTLIFDN